MALITLDISKVTPFTDKKSFNRIQEEIHLCHKSLLDRSGKGSNFLGWIDLPVNIDKNILLQLKEDALKIRQCAEFLVVIGVGGSYLGTRAVIDALNDPFSAFNAGLGHPQIVYAGKNLSEDYHAALMELLDKEDYAVAVISKSGTTTESAVAFRLIRAHVENKYGKQEARKRIFAITDAARGALKKLADTEGYSSYVIPDDVGGRYSVLTPVGLLPVAAAGFDIDKLIAGAAEMRETAISTGDCVKNPAAMYAGLRNILYRNNKIVEVLAAYEPSLQYFIEWWKQLYGESEGKEGKGIFPAGVTFTTDLHSMGQYLQDGLRIIFETVISVEKPKRDMIIPVDPENLDGLNFVAGKHLSEVNLMAELGTRLAHVDGQVPNIRISLPTIDEYWLGQLIYFFQFACGLSGYCLGVNPFDQPGVEAYKKNMFALLNKPGYEKESGEIHKRI